MKWSGEAVIVGVLGQWASGKSTAAETLVRHLGREGDVIFVTDRVLVAAQAINHILELDDSELEITLLDDGRRRLAGKLAAVYLEPGEDLANVDLNTLLFDFCDEVYDGVKPSSYSWLDKARLELGQQILKKSADGRPVVAEAGFGTNVEPRGENPFSQTLSDLFTMLEEAGVELYRIRWIIIESSYTKRSERNRKRKDSVPVVEFDRFAADGGDLDPVQEERYEAQGVMISRVSNDHDDIEQFRNDIIHAFEEMTLQEVSPRQ
jgi:hypothetical protein